MDRVNNILQRNEVEKNMKSFLQTFDHHVTNIHMKKGIYIYGPSGVGKTTFVKQLLKTLNYDVISYDSSDTRNKNIIESITHNNVSSCNIMNLFYREKKKIIILMDDVESMNNNGGLSSLIKLIRQKKTKRQKNELQSIHPFICIGNGFIDKKIKELMKICHAFEFFPPTKCQMEQIIQVELKNAETAVQTQLLELSHCNLCTFYRLLSIHRQNPKWIFDNQYQPQSFSEDCKKITKTLLQQSFHLHKHTEVNDTERTIVSLLWHENVPDFLPKTNTISLYSNMLKNICFADYIDRITFQNQIWQFNEMSSLIKTMYNNHILHQHTPLESSNEIRFTKVLTKYSTEYNNYLFLYHLCQKLDLDKKDLLCFFYEMKLRKVSNYDGLIASEITKLDIKRIFRFLERNDKPFEEVIDEEAIIQEVELEKEMEKEVE